MWQPLTSDSCMRSPAAVSIVAWPAASMFWPMCGAKLCGSAQSRSEILEGHFPVTGNDVGGCELGARSIVQLLLPRPLELTPHIEQHKMRTPLCLPTLSSYLFNFSIAIGVLLIGERISVISISKQGSVTVKWCVACNIPGRLE